MPRALGSLEDRHIEPREVMQVLASPARRPVAADAGGQEVLTIQGRTHDGRPLLVVVHQEGKFSWSIVGARDLTPDEEKDFRAWEAA